MRSVPLDASDRQMVYARSLDDPGTAAHIEALVASSGKRDVGKGALTNLKTIFHSRKCGDSRVLESASAELLFAYECEMNPAVLGYYCQVRCQNIRRKTRTGRNHVSSATLDFLVFHTDRIVLVECKPLGSLMKLSQQPSSDWTQSEGTWTNVAYAAFAQQHGIGLQVYVPPELFGNYLRNMELCYAAAGASLDDCQRRAARDVAKCLTRGPASLTALISQVDGLAVPTVLWMIGHGLVYAPLKSQTVNRPDELVIYPDTVRASMADAEGLLGLQRELKQPSKLSILSTASAVDAEATMRRYAHVKKIVSGEVRGSQRMRALARQVVTATDEGHSPIECCLTRYSDSGNRTPRLMPEQYALVDDMLRDHWDSGKCAKPIDLYYAMCREAAARGLTPVSRTMLERSRRRRGMERHELALRGMRGFQTVRSRVDPRYRLMDPVGYGHTIHVDSSRFDLRVAPDIARNLPAEFGVFYVAIDGCSGMPMAYSFIFGSARTDGLALLWRDYVQRHGELPALVHHDRGPENLGDWAKAFYAMQTSVRVSPTAGSAWNGMAENLIKKVNWQLAEKLPGNTANDRRGRSSDGRCKSAKQHKVAFLTVLAELERLLFEDIPGDVAADGRSPLERKAEAIERFGRMGTPTLYDEDFVYRTSVPIKLPKTLQVRHGIRLSEGVYTSTELQIRMRSNKINEIRIDPGSLQHVYVRIAGMILKAFHSKVLEMAMDRYDAQLFDKLCIPSDGAKARDNRDEIRIARYDRLDRVKQSARSDSEWVRQTRAANTLPPTEEETDKEAAPVGPAWDEIDSYPTGPG